MQKFIVIVLALLISMSFVGCWSGEELDSENNAAELDTEKNMEIYQNDLYGFSFNLPKSWEGYQVLAQEWEGYKLGKDFQEQIDITGPMIVLRHPLWTEETERQDIPIMILTWEQWTSLEQQEFHIGAAPMDPKELGRNSQFVFALPARYNYAFPAGYEEVDELLENEALQVHDNIEKQ